ncbi:M13 family metallopeptidase [Tabrizicola sp. J26]|uniref:M13 family metallopeptidase n=1 Tax=Alitabrizicola rongguiensis TaxID=2909234 RepID=UPI001F21A52E|nr:M13 family metallopeptidase [Tabrizicola rongguiensis]MCF1710543.1 M13 family metallopeptidase [Tabrizicola rongguiensis]
MFCLRHAAPLFLPLLLGTTALAQSAAEIPPPGPDELSFSITNMDPSVSPGTDFYRYASGAWQDRVQRPETLASYGMLDIMGERQKAQMKVVLAQAGAEAATAPKGSPVQQVGTLYNAFLDTAARDAAGMKPLQPQLDAIAAIQSNDDLVRYLATSWINTSAPPALIELKPDIGFADSSQYVMMVYAGAFGVPFDDVLAEPPDGPRRSAYKTYLTQVLQVAGYDPTEAARMADLATSIESALQPGKLNPIEANEPVMVNNPITVEAMQAQIPELDLQLYLDTIGIPKPGEMNLMEPRYFAGLSKVLREHSLQDIKDYITVLTIAGYSGVLSTAFDEPTRAWSAALSGVPVLPSMEERGLALAVGALGHPVSQIYVKDFFTDEQKAGATELIGQIVGAFKARIPTRNWLTEATRSQAMAKVDALTVRVGYPDTWIDFSGVEIGPDLVTNLNATAAFQNRRMLAKFGKPVVLDQFSTKNTYAVAQNAAYNPQLNGFEIPAAILQAPMYDPDKDFAVNVCRIGAVIGHELTHGFDSMGRQFDAQGNIRDWWTPADAEAFNRQAQKLIDQANAYEVLPGLMGNGTIEVGENMADVGGLTLAMDVLHQHLAQHPDQNVKIDGLTPEQRCFLSWAQLWTTKSSDEFLRLIIANDPHPPGPYRAVAAPQNLDAFYQAFGIKDGDPMWLQPEKRVQAW